MEFKNHSSVFLPPQRHIEFIVNAVIPAGQPPKGVNYGPFIVGFSKHRLRKGEEPRGVKCHLRLPKPVGNKHVEILMKKAVV